MGIRTTRRGSTRGVVVVAVAVVCAVAPVVPAGAVMGVAAKKTAAPARTSAANVVPAGAVKVASAKNGKVRVDRPVMTPTMALRGAGDPNSIATYARAERRLLETRFTTRYTDLRARASERASAAKKKSAATAAAPGPGDSIVRAGYPAGDLDGDGLGDVAIYELDYMTGALALVATKGTSGAELWRTPLDYYDSFVLPPAGDLTGDGATDVVTLDLGAPPPPDATCIAGVCAALSDFTFTWTLAVRSGTTGAIVWHHDFAGHAQRLFASTDLPGLISLLDVATITNALVAPTIAGDVSGDGLPDLALTSYDVTGARVFLLTGIIVGAVADIAPMQFTNRAEVDSGRDGAVLSTRVTGSEPAAADLQAAGDLVGDARPDLVWTEFAPDQPVFACLLLFVTASCAPQSLSLTVTALDGSSLAPAWQTKAPVASDSFGVVITPLRVDTTGDGRAELVLSDFGLDSVTDTVVAGNNGASVWHRTSAYDESALIVAGALDAAPGADIVILRFTDSSSEKASVIHQLAGSTGATLATVGAHTYTAAPDSTLFGYFFGGTDLSGDGVADFAANIGTFLPNGTTPTNVFAQSGASGATFVDRVYPGYVASDVTGDLDGNGAADLLVDAPQTTFPGDVLTVISMPAATNAWMRTVDFTGYVFIGLGAVATPDVDGDGGDDLLLNLFAGLNDGTSRSPVVAWNGRTSTALWRVGPAL